MATLISRNIKHLRLYLGLTLEEMGEIIGYDPSQISRWETAERNPSEQFCEAIIEKFHIKAHRLYGVDLEIEDKQATGGEIDSPDAGAAEAGETSA